MAPIFAVFLVGVVLGFFIIRADKTSIGSDSHEGAESDPHEEGESGHMEGEHAEGSMGKGNMLREKARSSSFRSGATGRN
ncbi:MAG: hypothetical protein MPW14_25925 (plasmid) [Candidatus Manganitrophus sp.]|nr:MAG: hypothetical protein MPW14_25925 [Candidatus Manganitrophus sp.]